MIRMLLTQFLMLQEALPGYWWFFLEVECCLYLDSNFWFTICCWYWHWIIEKWSQRTEINWFWWVLRRRQKHQGYNLWAPSIYNFSQYDHKQFLEQCQGSEGVLWKPRQKSRETGQQTRRDDLIKVLERFRSGGERGKMMSKYNILFWLQDWLYLFRSLVL